MRRAGRFGDGYVSTMTSPDKFRRRLPDNRFIDHPELHDQGILIEPDSREPWFLCEAHNVECLDETLDKFERAVDITTQKLSARAQSA